MLTIKYDKSLKVKNTEQLASGRGCPFLEVMTSHVKDEYIAVQWRRNLQQCASDHILIDFR